VAITTADVMVWKRLREAGVIPAMPRVLEIGQANWAGDYSPEGAAQLIREWGGVDGPVLADDFMRAIVDNDSFGAARRFYEAALDPGRVDAIDLNGTASAMTLDLNEPISLGDLYDVVINTGTAEHVWDVSQVFRTIHDATAVGGLMVHTLPFRGWLNHGYWQVNPILLTDLAAANDYELLACGLFDPGQRIVWLNEPATDAVRVAEQLGLGANTLIQVAWRKTVDAPLAPPMQGDYVKSTRRVAS
jgi:hypothetical protein